MSSSGLITFLLIVVNVLVSYRGFTNTEFFAKYDFEVEKILLYKDYKRLVTSGFLHTGWLHLLFNMYSLYVFSGMIAGGLGAVNYLIIYFTSLIGGNLFALWVHRNHRDYSAVGASGAVWGVIFATVALYPEMDISIFPIPLSIPNWIYALLFVAFTIYAIRSQQYNIGHDAHLGGAIIGMILALILEPAALFYHWGKILIILLPSVAFLYIIITRPHLLFVDNLFFKTHRNLSIDQRYNVERADQQQEIDRILDKIHRKGMRSLNKKERETLKAYSKNVR